MLGGLVLAATVFVKPLASCVSVVLVKAGRIKGNGLTRATESRHSWSPRGQRGGPRHRGAVVPGCHRTPSILGWLSFSWGLVGVESELSMVACRPGSDGRPPGQPPDVLAASGELPSPRDCGARAWNPSLGHWPNASLGAWRAPRWVVGRGSPHSRKGRERPGSHPRQGQRARGRWAAFLRPGLLPPSRPAGSPGAFVLRDSSGAGRPPSHTLTQGQPVLAPAGPGAPPPWLLADFCPLPRPPPWREGTAGGSHGLPCPESSLGLNAFLPVTLCNRRYPAHDADLNASPVSP